MMRSRHVALAGAALLGLALPVGTRAATERPLTTVVTEGSRIRVSAPGARGEVIGTLVRRDSSDVEILPEGEAGPVWIPVSSIVELEMSGGRRSYAGRGLWIGALAGGVGGVIVGATLDLDSDNNNANEIFAASVLGLGGALVAGGLGALIGALIHGERWQPASLDAPRLGIAPLPGGAQFVVAVPFGPGR